jgi:acyl dehydratase
VRERASHSVVARNDAVASENKIHDDAVARGFGFRGGLVPGVTVYAYLTNPAARRWGPDWAARGTITARFLKPVYDGEAIDVVATPHDDCGLDLVAVGPDGEVRATATAALPEESPPAGDPASFPAAEPPSPEARPAASTATLMVGRSLGTVDRVWDAAAATSYLDMIGEDIDWYRTLPVAHPGWLLRAANRVLHRSVALGPWIHVGSDVVHHGTVTHGTLVSTRGRVAEVYERRGHKFVELDVLALADGHPVLSARHVAIYEPRTPSGATTSTNE